MRACALLLVAAGCASALPEVAPPLADMEEPLPLLAEPDDEAARAALPPGTYSGVEVGDPRTTLEERLTAEAAPGVLVVAVADNSPGDAAGLCAGDLLLSARVGPAALRDLGAPSVWRQLELESRAGDAVQLRVDRAGRLFTASLTLGVRVRRPARHTVERLREEERAGVVLRTATEVEARAAGLGPGGGAVVVGLSRGSPWRAAGVRFGDVLTAIDGRAVASPQVVLEAIRNAPRDAVALALWRAGVLVETSAPLSERARELQEFGVPLLFTHRVERGTSTTSCLLGLVHYRSTAVAWRARLLWLFTFGAGDADRLVEVAR